MYKILSVEQMRKLDEITINETGINGLVLMENAGKAVVEYITQCITAIDWEKIKNSKKPITIICGKGNNGGDGFVIARQFININIDVNIILLGNENNLSGDAKTNFSILKKMEVEYHTVLSNEDLNNKIKSLLSHSKIIIDAIFGTGFQGEIRGYIKDIIDYTNSLINIVKVAVDVPSGILCNSNKIPKTYFHADYTLTLGLPKLSFVLEPVCHYIGKFAIKNITFPQNKIDSLNSNIYLISKEDIENYIPQKKSFYHKGDSGKVFIIGGSTGLTGAACLTAAASLKSGAGLVTVGCAESLNHIFESKLTECMSYPLNDENGFIIEDAIYKISDFSNKTDIIVFGPGIGRHPRTTKLLSDILKISDKPLLIDADGLYHLTQNDNLQLLKKYKNSVILTPHIKEFSKLVDIPILDILDNKFEILNNFSREYNVITVLKGKFTSITFPNDKIYVINAGNELLATGGTGDVLTGIISGYIALGNDLKNNLTAAVYIHSAIADDLKKYNNNIIASDIIENLKFYPGL